MKVRETFEVAVNFAVAAASVYAIGRRDGRESVEPLRTPATTGQLLEELRERTAQLPNFAPQVVELSEAFAAITRAHNDAGALNYPIPPGE